MTSQIVKIKNYLRGPYFIGSDKFITPVPVSMRLLPGDILKDNKLIERKISGLIFGVLDVLNRTGQGFTARGTPLYLFYPFDPAWPPFYVSYKERSSENLLVSIAFEHWDSGAWPRGGLRKIHGCVGNTEIERELLIKTYNSTNNDLVDSSIPFPALLGYRETTKWDAVFNIDPVGCEDVDDIFAWRYCGDEIYEFMIAIADVSAWIPSDCAIDMRARTLGQTLYDDGTVVAPMLPTSLSTRTASLRCDGVERPVVGLVYTIKEHKVVSSAWQLHNVALTKCYTYESILEDEDACIQLYDYLKIVCKNKVSHNDSHDWVAQAMIAYNHAAAELLSSVGLGILRRHSGAKISEYTAIAEKSNCATIANLGMAAGEYIIGSSLQTSHDGLGLDVYCHATSPLRRYADLVNQRVLKYLVFGQTWTLGTNIVGANTFVDHLNMRAAAAKNLERELWFLSHIKPDKISVAQGIVLSCKDETRNLWSVFVPDWKRKINGVPATDTIVEIGGRVSVRAYANLRCANWRERIVCQLTVENRI